VIVWDFDKDINLANPATILNICLLPNRFFSIPNKKTEILY